MENFPMDKNEFIERIKKIEQDKKGIVNIIENQGRFAYVTPINSMYGSETLYISDEYMTDSYLLNECLNGVSDEMEQYGVTKEYVLDGIKKEFGPFYKDILRTVLRIVIMDEEFEPDTEESNVCLAESDEKYQSVLVNTGVVKSIAKQIYEKDNSIPFNDLYRDTIMTAVKYELRHYTIESNLMLDAYLYKKYSAQYEKQRPYMDKITDYCYDTPIYRDRNDILESIKEAVFRINENDVMIDSIDAYDWGVCVSNNEHGLFINFSYDHSLTDNYIKSCILIGQAAKKRGITEGYILNAIKEKYGKDYKEAIRTLGFICIPESEKDLDNMLLNANINLNDEDEYGLYCSLGYDKNLYSYTFADVQTIMINEPLYRHLPDEEYKQKILDSLFDEIEFLLTTTNFIITESLFNKTVPNLKDPQVYRTSLEEYNEEEHEL